MTSPLLVPIEVPTTRRESLQAMLRPHAGWLLFVALPTLVTGLYLGLIAADQYAAEARFVVRSPSRMSASTGISSFLGGAALSGGHDDVYSVQEFATSRDAIGLLSKKVDLRAMFARPGADWLARYPNLIDDESEEDFRDYFARQVSVVYDTTSGICTMTVKAFRADDAERLAQLLLDESEALVNRLNERARSNAVHDAEQQLQLVQKQAEDAEQNLLAYRRRETMLDPGEVSGAISKTIAGLQGELSATRVQLDELSRRAPNSPLRGQLSGRISSLQKQIDHEQERLAGKGVSMAPKMAEYELLSLRREFAAKQLSSAMGSLEAARSEARRQQIYLDRVVEPNLPDKALYPKRWRICFIVLVASFLIYSVARLLMAGVREHAQH